MQEQKENEEPVESVTEIIETGIEKGKDLTDGEELFNIEMSNDSRGITVKIHCADSADAVLIAGFVISAFRKLGIESKSVSKVMP